MNKEGTLYIPYGLGEENIGSTEAIDTWWYHKNDDTSIINKDIAERSKSAPPFKDNTEDEKSRIMKIYDYLDFINNKSFIDKKIFWLVGHGGTSHKLFSKDCNITFYLDNEKNEDVDLLSPGETYIYLYDISKKKDYGECHLIRNNAIRESIINEIKVKLFNINIKLLLLTRHLKPDVSKIQVKINIKRLISYEQISFPINDEQIKDFSSTIPKTEGRGYIIPRYIKFDKKHIKKIMEIKTTQDGKTEPIIKFDGGNILFTILYGACDIPLVK